MAVLIIFMEFVFIFLLQVIGFFFKVNGDIKRLDKKYPELSYREIKDLYYEEEWSSFGGSILLLILQLTIHLAILIWFPALRESSFTIPIINWVVPFVVSSFVLAFVTGYLGQWAMYKLLGKVETIIDDKLK